MKILPPRMVRREVVGLLRDFYVEHDRKDLDEAIRLLCAYYGVGRPRIRWKRRIMNGAALGLTWEDGQIDLIHPRVWARRKTENTETEWCAVVLHECHHHIFWANAEVRADRFAERLIRDAE